MLLTIYITDLPSYLSLVLVALSDSIILHSAPIFSFLYVFLFQGQMLLTKNTTGFPSSLALAMEALSDSIILYSPPIFSFLQFSILHDFESFAITIDDSNKKMDQTKKTKK